MTNIELTLNAVLERLDDARKTSYRNSDSEQLVGWLVVLGLTAL